MSVATQSVISDSILGFGANVYSRLADAAGIGTDTYSALTTLYEEASQDANLSFKMIDLPKEDKLLLNQLQEEKVKLTEEDILFVTKDKTNQIVWLEKGNQGAGLKHIMDGDGKTSGHAKNFQDALGIRREDVPAYLKRVISEGDVVSNVLKPVKNRMGYERIYYYKGNYYMLAGIGTNGFISSAYPIKQTEFKRLIRRNKR